MSPGRIFAGLALAELHLERGDDEQAVQMLDEATPRHRRQSPSDAAESGHAAAREGGSGAR